MYTEVLPILTILELNPPIVSGPVTPVSILDVLIKEVFNIDIFTRTPVLPIFMDVAFVVPILNGDVVDVSNNVAVILLVDMLFADKLRIDTLNIDTLLAVILLVDMLLVDTLFADKFPSIFVIIPLLPNSIEVAVVLPIVILDAFESMVEHIIEFVPMDKFAVAVPTNGGFAHLGFPLVSAIMT